VLLSISFEWIFAITLTALIYEAAALIAFAGKKIIDPAIREWSCIFYRIFIRFCPMRFYPMQRTLRALVSSDIDDKAESLKFHAWEHFVIVIDASIDAILTPPISTLIIFKLRELTGERVAVSYAAWYLVLSAPSVFSRLLRAPRWKKKDRQHRQLLGYSEDDFALRAPRVDCARRAIIHGQIDFCIPDPNDGRTIVTRSMRL